MSTPITLRITDPQGRLFTALELGEAEIRIWDHSNAQEVAITGSWRDTAAALEMLQR